MIAFVALQAVAVPFLIVLFIVAIVLVAIFARVFGEAVKRNPNRPGGEKEEERERRDE
jgi:hypothetical protein